MLCSNITYAGTQFGSAATKAAVAGGVAADITVMTNWVTSDGDGADNVTLADGTAGQLIEFVYKTEGAGGDTVIITPATATYFNTITMNVQGDGCTMRHDGNAWAITGNNGCTVA